MPSLLCWFTEVLGPAKWKPEVSALVFNENTSILQDSGDLTSGQVVLFAPLKQQSWQLGLVLTVWRIAAKGGCRPSALPIAADLVRCMRITTLSPVPNREEGTYGAYADSCTTVVPAYRLGLVLKVKSSIIGVDGLRVTLDSREMQIVKGAREWTRWTMDPKQDMRLNRKRKASDAVIDLDSENETEAANASAALQLFSRLVKCGWISGLQMLNARIHDFSTTKHRRCQSKH